MTRSFRKVANASPVVTGALAAAASAFVVGALWVHRRARKAERANPPLGRFIEVDGVRLHYIDRGKGPAVVLLHGNTVLLQDFISSGLMDRLSEHHRVIAFDRPGFGYSERPRDRLWTAQAQAELMQRALKAIGAEQPVLVGHSWGSLVALGMAVDFPGEVKGLVLISGYYYPTGRVDVAVTAPVALPVLGDVMRYTVAPLTGRLLLERTVETMFAPAPVPDSFWDAVPREMLLRPKQIRAVAQDGALMVPAAAYLRTHYPKLDIPVRIFAGDGDKIVDTEAHSAPLHRALPHSTLLVAPGVGHMAHYQLVSQIVAAIDRITINRDEKRNDSVVGAIGAAETSLVR